MYVYIMKCSNYYKIGHSKNPHNRRATIQTHNPLDVKICALLKTESFLEIEKKLHNHFITKRSRGEWFELEESDLITLKIDFDFEFKIKISSINKTNFDNTKNGSETKNFRLNNLNLETAIAHFENIFDCSVINAKKIKSACLKYDIEIVMKCINDLFERDYDSDFAISKLLNFCKYENEKRVNPSGYLIGIIKSIYRNHYKIELTDANIESLKTIIKNINNVDAFLKKINSKKFYCDFQEFWDKLPEFSKNQEI